MKKLLLIIMFLSVVALQPTVASAYGIGVPPVTGLGTKVGRVLGISAKVTCPSSTDKQAADYIPFNQAPTVVRRAFNEVYGRSIKHNESVYWKERARCDKATESKLKDTMMWHKSVASFGPRIEKTDKVFQLKSSLSDIFSSVFGRGPSVSESSYWTSRIIDKLSAPALYGAMLFHLWSGLLH